MQSKKLNWTIRKMIIGGFSSLIALILVVGGIAYFALQKSSQGFTEYREMARDSNLAAHVQANKLMARMNAKDYIITHSEEDSLEFLDYYASTQKYLKRAMQEIQKPERAEKVERASSMVTDYREGFEQVTKLMDKRNELVNNGINAIGPEVRKKLSTIMDTAYMDNDVAAAFYAGVANKHLLLGRLYVMKFLETNAPDQVERANEELNQMQESMQILDKELQNPERRALLAASITGIEDYRRSFEKIVEVIYARNDIITNTLDRIGPLVSDDLEFVKMDIQQVQDTLGPALVEANESSTMHVAAVAGGATVLALIIGFLIITFTSRRLREVIDGLSSSARQVDSASSQLSSASQDLATGSSEQAASIETTSAALEEMAAMTKSNAESALQADNIMVETRTIVSDANGAMNELVKSMEDITQSSQETSGIIKTIDEIAFQTNILALNAAVEAARAGDAGQGFAVVAEEVRSLAMRTATAAKDTSQLIEGSLVKIQNGSKSLDTTSKKFEEINESTERVGSLVSAISEASAEQSAGIASATQSIAEMESVTQASAASAEETAASANTLEGQSTDLASYIVRLATLVGK